MATIRARKQADGSTRSTALFLNGPERITQEMVARNCAFSPTYSEAIVCLHCSLHLPGLMRGYA